jgi:CBS domain-containing protein
VAGPSIPTVEAVMTSLPLSIGVDDRVLEARELMAEHDIRHLPVTEDGRLVGVVSQRDIALALDPELDVPFHEELRVGTVCSLDAYLVEPETPLDAVVAEMARRRIGSALVARRGRLLGILTATDACRLLADALHGRPLGPPAGLEA